MDTKKNCTMMMESFQKGEKRCCQNEAKFRVTYINSQTWLVCSDCFKLEIWNRFIKSKIELCKTN